MITSLRMRRVFALILILAIAGACFFLTSCNRQVIDLTYKFDWAIIALPNGDTVEGPVEGWKDYEDGDQLQVKINGVTYLTHAGNVVLCSERP